MESGKLREEIIGNLLSAEIPQYGAKFIIFVKTDAVIYRVEFARFVFKEDVTAFAIGVVDEQVEQDDGLEELFVVVRKVEVMIPGVMLDELLDRTRAVGTVFAQRGERDDVQAQRLAHEIRRHFACRQRLFGKIPQRLLAATRFVHGGIGFLFVRDLDQKCVIRAKHELTFEFKVAVLEGLLKVFLTG